MCVMFHKMYHEWKKIGTVMAVSFNIEEKETSILVFLNTFHRPHISQKSVSVRLIVMEGEYEGRVFKDNEVMIEGNLIRVGLVKQTNILHQELVDKIDFTNPLDLVLIEMGEIDELIKDLKMRDLD